MTRASVQPTSDIVECRQPSKGTVARLLAAATRRVERALRRRRGRRLLAGMNDRALADIGLVRSDIGRVVRRGRY
jgi:uncharacterized protein YjiS (DUF1127 family)